MIAYRNNLARTHEKEWDSSAGVGPEYKIVEGNIIDASKHFTYPISRVNDVFYLLLQEWRDETGFLSSITAKAMHPAYQQIIGMGRDALPYIFRELQQGPAHFFWALKAITGDDPIANDDRGNLKKMTESWLDWARDKGYIF